MAIEAGLVVAAVAIKPEEAKRIMGRHQRALTPPEEKKPQPPALALLDGFRAHGLAVVEQTVAKPSV